jgi:AAA+ superfamily predicted ATPase
MSYLSNLVSKYVGHTGQKVIRMFERALGKVLFIDEAYRLGRMRAVDAIGEIVDCMTKERFARKIIIILAGYEDDMNKLMQLNRGLRSRFATDVIFRPMRLADSLALLGKLVGKLDIQLDGITPANPSRGPVLRILAQLAATKSWANGRDVEALSQKVIEHAFKYKATATNPTRKVIVHTDELLPLLKSRLARAKKEDAELAGDCTPDENADWGPLHNDGSNSTHGDDEHKETNNEVPGATTLAANMILSNRDPGPSRDSRQAMTPGDQADFSARPL